ncbi:MAG: pyridoxamine 5'-phosphate oxidase family protein [Candidatus Aenigmarchaeota archaeon]|nr:pyridoxamine 5'-phosphate oxidase family protein [Candidatus Aenigmarchaeota archaeon]
MSAEIKKLVADYLNKARLMQVATANGNRPWVATVWFAYDKDLNFYFISRKTRRHSLEIKDNPSVAGAIVTHHRTLGDKVRGLQFEGKASEVSLINLPKAFSVFTKRFPKTKNYLKSVGDIAKNMTEQRLYKVKPSKIILFDEVKFPNNPKQELSL